jgi:hypothetical protein
MKLSEIKIMHLVVLLVLIVIVMGAIQIYQTNRLNELLRTIIVS